MSLLAAYYMHSTDFLNKKTVRKIGASKRIKILDLCRPDIWMIHDVDRMIGIWMFFKKEIEKYTEYCGRCDHFYRHSKTTKIISGNYRNILIESMSRIFLGFAKEMGRGSFDEQYSIDDEIKVPVRFYKSHAPLEWGKTQMELINEITNIPKPVRLKWSPNKLHKKATTAFGFSLCFDGRRVWYEFNYRYARDLYSYWTILIFPQKKQMILDFMLDVNLWISRGFCKKDLVSISQNEYENEYRFCFNKEKCDGDGN